MRRLLLLILITFTTAIVATATKWSATTLPVPYLQDNRKYVSNPDGILSPSAEDSTNLILQSLEREKGVQTLVVVVKQIEGDDPYQFGMDLCKRYGFGSGKQKTGLVVILATEDRSYQILTGDGLEGTLPDAICRRIQNQVMLPCLKEKAWDNAIVLTVKAISGYIHGDDTLTRDEEDDEEGIWAGLGIALAMLVFFIIFFLADQKKYNCPQCKKRMRLIQQDKVRITNSNIFKERRIYKCPHCGYERTFYKNLNNSNGGGAVPPILFGGMGGGSSSGGITGGTFGGGTFSGGGSGGRF